MKNLFVKQTPAPDHSSNAFDLSHEKKMSFKMGHLVPIYMEDNIPGDSFRVSSEVFIRFAPLLAPILHRVDVFTHYFFVPYRLLMPSVGLTYADWEGFITGDPDSEFTNVEIPTITMDSTNQGLGCFNKGSLADYFGLPVVEDTDAAITQDIEISALPFMAYHLIYDHYYRDQQLINKRCGISSSYAIPLIGGTRDNEAQNVCPNAPLVRAWEKDLLTAGLTTAYAGALSDVELDLDIAGLGFSTGANIKLQTTGGTPAAGGIVMSSSDLKDSAADNLYFKSGNELPAAATLELYELRRAQALLRSLEAEKRGGRRYQEFLLAKFGVIGEGYKTAYPQYLGGGKQAVNISSTQSTTQALDPTAGVNDGAGGVPVTIDPQSNLSGNALSIGKTNKFTKRYSEHGITIGILSVIPRTSYSSQGIEKYWTKTDRHDFFDPYLQRVGDQELTQKEVYYDPTGTDADDVFSYVPRWSEYKQRLSKLSGDFRDDFDYWHMARKFTSAPSFNQAFIECRPTNDENNRIFAVEDTAVDKLYAQVYNNVQAIRPMYLHDIAE